MGFFKKIFKPVAKVFDKIIPNEIKPALPYLAAFAPMMMPAAASGSFMSSMLGRGLMSGGLNIGAQLAQEGNEGDINALSALLAGGVGALTAPGAGDTLRGATTQGNIQGLGSTMEANTLANRSLLTKASDSGLGFLAKGADKLSAINAAGAADPFSMAGLKAAAIPLSQGTGDLMYAEGTRALKDYEQALLDYENGLAEGQFATDAGRRAAIISAMTAGQHSQQVIDDTLAELGLRNGGRVTYAGGGNVLKGNAVPGGVGGPMPMGLGVPPSGNYADNFLNRSEKMVTTNNTMSPSNNKRRQSIITAMKAGKHSQQVIDGALAELGLRNGGIISLQNGGRVNFRGGGMDYMPTEPEIMGNPAVMEMILPGDDMRENRIMNPDVEDIADYKSFYEDKKEGIEQILTEEKITEPDFGGIEEAIENVDIKEKGKNLEDVGKLIESSDESILRKFLTSKLVQEGRYALSEFLMNDPILFGTPDKFKDGKNNKRGTFKRDSSEYDKLSKEKQAYIEAFLNSDEGQLFLKPGKIRFPTDEKMREHNKKITLEDFNEDRNPLELLLGIDYENRADGGIMNGYNMGGSVLPQGMEMDYRGGGFIPMGSKERADDVPARVSKNEFVMTADAVRAAGGGSVNEGAKKMYEVMNNLEARA